MLSPPDSWGRQLAAGAVNKDKSEPHHRVMRFGSLLSPPDSWGRQLAAGAGKRTRPRKDSLRSLLRARTGCAALFAFVRTVVSSHSPFALLVLAEVSRDPILLPNK